LTAPSLRAFSSGCRRFGRLCEAAASVPADDERAAREFFEANFSPYALISSETGDRGLITGYYEPVIEGSRTRSDVNRYPILGVPEDLVVVDLAAINPSCATCACAAEWKAAASCPITRAGKSTGATARCRRR